MSALTVRVPDAIYAHLRRVAQKEGASVNPFFVTALAEKLAAFSLEPTMTTRELQDLVAYLLSLE